MDTGPGFYEIRVAGYLAPCWMTWFDPLALQHEPGGSTLLSGRVADQAALYGVLNQINDLGLTLISVNRLVSSEPPPGASRAGGAGQCESDIYSA